ncbi:ABC transporter ATP-binding protein [Pantoea cypripedii]|uniref:ABC transporter n=1 Tax=Pantoea cypripedii TaxID=55209 RepID=A0A6B9G4Y8_PANCY|nr:sn-glycerol-3-phosphate ABC transporter ATP-binding protein UgpC [Pantoea cypripedii]QGY32594.1 ABC transporter [Pantoea cypripedii]
MGCLRLKAIGKEYADVPVLKNINLTIEEGEFVVIVGPSGSGKSTLLRMIAGLEDISSGEMYLNEVLINDTLPQERSTGMVFQSYALYPHMSVAENMAYGLKLAGLNKTDITARVRHAADMLQLTPYLDRKPASLSGGQRQRVAIGRALTKEPALFLFDEPLSNLDAALRVDMRVQIARLHQRLRATMIYVTHDQVEAMTLADRIVMMSGGKIAQVGSPLTLYHHPATLEVAQFIGSPRMNVFPVSVVDTAPDGIVVSLPETKLLSLPLEGKSLPSGEKLQLGVRPEHLYLTDAAQAHLTSEVVLVEKLGYETLLYHQIPGIDEPLTQRLPGDSGINVGDRVSLRINDRQCHLFAMSGEAYSS